MEEETGKLLELINYSRISVEESRFRIQWLSILDVIV